MVDIDYRGEAVELLYVERLPEGPSTMEINRGDYLLVHGLGIEFAGKVIHATEILIGGGRIVTYASRSPSAIVGKCHKVWLGAG